MDAVNGNATENMTASQDVSLESGTSMRKLFEQRRNPMKNYGRLHRAETMYCMLLPYKDAMKENVPAKIRLMLAVNNWINPWHAIQELSKEIPFKRRQKLKGDVI